MGETTRHIFSLGLVDSDGDDGEAAAESGVEYLLTRLADGYRVEAPVYGILVGSATEQGAVDAFVLALFNRGRERQGE